MAMAMATGMPGASGAAPEADRLWRNLQDAYAAARAAAGGAHVALVAWRPVPGQRAAWRLLGDGGPPEGSEAAAHVAALGAALSALAATLPLVRDGGRVEAISTLPSPSGGCDIELAEFGGGPGRVLATASDAAARARRAADA